MPINIDDWASPNLELLVSDETLTSGAVSQWSDQSENARHLTASGGPTVGTGPNGAKAVVFSGSSNPLKNTTPFAIQSGFIVCKTTAVSNYSGLISSTANVYLLSVTPGAPFFYDNRNLSSKTPYDWFGYRLNNLTYPPAGMLAPSEWSIIYFSFLGTVDLDGIQLGQDRSDASRKLNGSIAFVALYSNWLCEEDYQKRVNSLARNYQIPIAPVFPFQASKADTAEYGEVVVTDGASIPNLEIIRGERAAFEATFSNRQTREFLAAREFRSRYRAKSFVFRDAKNIPPVDTVVGFAPDSKIEDKGNTNNGMLRNYGTSFVEYRRPLEYSIPDLSGITGAPPDTRQPTIPELLTVQTLAASTPAIRGKWNPAIAFGGRNIVKYLVKVDGGAVYDAGLNLAYDVGSFPLAGEEHSLQIAAFDGVYTSAYSLPLSAPAGAGSGETTDNTAPAGSIIDPTEGQSISGNYLVKINATDNIKVESVRLKVDGASVGVPDMTPNAGTNTFTVTWNTSASGNGSHSLTALVTDTSGNTYTTAAVTAIVSNVSPPLTPQPPSNPQTFDANNTINWTNSPDAPLVSDYEWFNGTVWADVTAKPQPVGNITAAAGVVKLRVKAGLNRTISQPIVFGAFSATDTTPPSAPTGCTAEVL